MTEPSAGEAAVEALARDVATRLDRVGATVATAESLTGGLLGAALTGVPGVSGCYRGGIVAYATDVKANVLGVPDDLLRRDGAVAASTAAAMAGRVRERLSTTYGVATTGVAGPESAEGKPAGTVFVAVAGGPDGAETAAHDFAGDRHQVRRAACAAALALLRRTLDRSADPGLDR